MHQASLSKNFDENPSSYRAVACLGQVFDATNTTRERREMILQFGTENDFKVSVTVAT